MNKSIPWHSEHWQPLPFRTIAATNFNYNQNWFKEQNWETVFSSGGGGGWGCVPWTESGPNLFREEETWGILSLGHTPDATAPKYMNSYGAVVPGPWSLSPSGLQPQTDGPNLQETCKMRETRTSSGSNTQIWRKCTDRCINVQIDKGGGSREGCRHASGEPCAPKTRAWWLILALPSTPLLENLETTSKPVFWERSTLFGTKKELWIHI